MKYWIQLAGWLDMQQCHVQWWPLSMATLNCDKRGQVPNEQFVYKTTSQQRPPLYKGQNFDPQSSLFIKGQGFQRVGVEKLSTLTRSALTVCLCALRQARWRAVFPTTSVMLASSSSARSSTVILSWRQASAARWRAVQPSTGLAKWSNPMKEREL